ncbi:MAG: hypothetical protein ABEK84_02730 [Salinibacter sp.]
MVLLLASLTGCAALREVANLRKVQFSIERVSNPKLAGLDLSGLQSYEDLRSADVLRLGSALTEGKLPFSFTLHLDAVNPKTNSVNARLTEMDWTLLLEGEKTVSGRFQQEVVLPPGEPKHIAIPITLDLVRFFDENLQGLVNLASAIAGNGPPQTLKLRVQPSISTPLGPFKYPSPITVVSEEVGTGTSQP